MKVVNPNLQGAQGWFSSIQNEGKLSSVTVVLMWMPQTPWLELMATTRGAPWALQRTSHQTWANDRDIWHPSQHLSISEWSQISPSIFSLREVWIPYEEILDLMMQQLSISLGCLIHPWPGPDGINMDILSMNMNEWKSLLKSSEMVETIANGTQMILFMDHQLRWAKELLHPILVQHQLPQLLHLVQALGLDVDGQCSIHDAMWKGKKTSLLVSEYHRISALLKYPHLYTGCNILRISYIVCVIHMMRVHMSHVQGPPFC